jgi:hypothetical protein
MSIQTVKGLSLEWHKAVAENMPEDQPREFPPPWFPESESGAYRFVPILNSTELYLEGKEMHHCVATYAYSAFAGIAIITAYSAAA